MPQQYHYVVDQNVINIDLDAPVWRVFNSCRLRDEIAGNRLTLVRDGMWDDPFENFLEKWQFILPTGESVRTDTILRRFFGQCWTHHATETDATWRIYSPDKHGVRVRSTVRALMTALWDQSDTFAELKYFVGRVRYVRQDAILTAMTSSGTATGLLVGRGGWDQINMLLVKRQEFHHEEEVRLLFRDVDDQHTAERLFQRSVDPNRIYLEATFDPRMLDDEYERQRSALIAAGFAGPISRSDLYQPPSGTAVLT